MMHIIYILIIIALIILCKYFHRGKEESINQYIVALKNMNEMNKKRQRAVDELWKEKINNYNLQQEIWASSSARQMCAAWYTLYKMSQTELNALKQRVIPYSDIIDKADGFTIKATIKDGGTLQPKNFEE